MDTGTKPFIYDLNFEDLLALVESMGEPKYRAVQIWQGIYHRLWREPGEFSSLPRGLREKLWNEFEFSHLDPITVLDSKDGETRKVLFRLPDGQAIEAVLMQYERRRSLCISTQAGCAMGCVFCATGQMGFRRNLSSGEIVEQVLYFARSLQEKGERVTNIVIMGMGEPFHNYEATLKAIDCLNHPDGFNLGERRFTISTVGLLPMIHRFTTERRQVNLAISLHAADDSLRSSMLPINHKYPISELMEACKEYVQTTHRRITFEWALIRDVNDTVDQAQKLVQLLKIFRQPESGEHSSTLCHVNIIPLNPTQKFSGQATTRQRALAFQAELEKQGIPCTIRIRRGIEIQAGCGQLAVRQSEIRS